MVHRAEAWSKGQGAEGAVRNREQAGGNRRCESKHAVIQIDRCET
jgi:hypothetical protein